MKTEDYIKKNLRLQGLPVSDADIPYIQLTLDVVNHTKGALKQFPDLNMEVPITIVDKELMS